MLLQLTDDQEFFRDTTARFLGEHVPVGELRRLRDDPAGFDRALLAAGRRAGLDLAARGRGARRRLASAATASSTSPWWPTSSAATPRPGPLVPTNVVAGRAERSRRRPARRRRSPGCSPGDAHRHLVPRPSPPPRPRSATVTARDPGRRRRRRARRRQAARSSRPAQAEPPAGHRAAPATASPRCSCPPTRPGVIDHADAARSTSPAASAVVAFDDVRVPAEAVVGEVGGAGERRRAPAAASPSCIANAESVGAMQAAFDMTVEWAFDRYSFGRPLASYQALKHRFADMKTWLEASHAISDDAAARRRRRRARRRRAGQRGQGLHRRATAPSWCRTACSCTAASASPSSTTCTCTCAATPCDRALYGTPGRAPAAPRRPRRRRSGDGERDAPTSIEDLERFRARARAWIREQPATPVGDAGRRRAPQRPHRRGGAGRGRPRPRGPAHALRRRPRRHLRPDASTAARASRPPTSRRSTRSCAGYEYPIALPGARRSRRARRCCSTSAPRSRSCATSPPS